jgi:hypothetical protein
VGFQKKPNIQGPLCYLSVAVDEMWVGVREKGVLRTKVEEQGTAAEKWLNIPGVLGLGRRQRSEKGKDLGFASSPSEERGGFHIGYHGVMP